MATTAPLVSLRFVRSQAHVIRLSSLYRDRHGASAAPSTLGAFTCAKVKPLKVLVREVASLVEMVNRSFG